MGLTMRKKITMRRKAQKFCFSASLSSVRKTKADARPGLAGHQNVHSCSFLISHFSFLTPHLHFHQPWADPGMGPVISKGLFAFKAEFPLLRAPGLLCSPTDLQRNRNRHSSPREPGEAELVPGPRTLSKCAFNLINV